MAIFPYAVLTD